MEKMESFHVYSMDMDQSCDHVYYHKVQLCKHKKMRNTKTYYGYNRHHYVILLQLNVLLVVVTKMFEKSSLT